MGYLYLVMAKIAAAIKMIAVKKCGNIASGAKNSVKINLIRSSGSLVIALIVCIFSGFQKMNGYGILFTLMSGFSQGIMLWSWILAATSAPMITVEVFCMIGGVVIPLIISPLMLEGESVTLLQWIGSLLLFLAMFCLSKRRGNARTTPKSILFMCIAGLSNAGCVITQKFYQSFKGGTVADFQLGTFIFTVTVLAFVLLLMNLFKKDNSDEIKKSLSKKVLFFITVAFIMTYASQFLSTVASGRIAAAVLYPLAYVISMPLIFIVDVLVFKEKITPLNVMGIMLVTASGILINI